MLRLTPRRCRRVLYGLAFFGAFLLAASVLAGAARSLPAAQQLAGIQRTTEASDRDVGTAAQLEAPNPVHEAAVTKTRKFRVNLFLFRH